MTDTKPETDTQSQTPTPTDTPTENGDGENEALQQRVAELESELEETRTELEETQAALETARQTATEAKEQLVYDKFVYARSLCSSGDEFFEQATNEWANQEFGAVIGTANRAIGLYLAGQEAAKEAAGQANEDPTAWSGDPSSAANTLIEYSREMDTASSTFIEAAKTARDGATGQADAIREDVAETVSAANELNILSADAFEGEL